MTFETREEVFEKVISMAKPKCPHCQNEMNIYEVPPITFSDGLGWGVPFLFLCANDDCPLYRQGWDHLLENYAHKASYRCINYPGTEQYEVMPVFGPMGAKGQIIDDEALLEEERIKEGTKRGFNLLAGFYVEKDGPAVVRMLTDATEPNRVRVKAAEMIGDIGELEAIEPLRMARFGNEILQNTVLVAIAKIHERHFTRECPFCAEIIKKRAVVCKHCGKEVAGI